MAQAHSGARLSLMSEAPTSQENAPTDYLVASRMQRHDLHKLHGLGNDFLVWFRPDVPDDAAERAKQWCDRRTGIGADGLIVTIDHRVAPRFVLFNADGSRAEVSGNGLRCFAHAIAARRGVAELDMIAETDAGDRALTVTDALSDSAMASVGMGAPGPGPKIGDIDLAQYIDYARADTIDMGNPHIVIEVPDLAHHDIATIGPAIEAHFMPTGINVHLVTPTEDGIRMLIWERGAGVTDACGSGACAATAIASLSRPDQTRFRVEMPGGSATVDVGAELTLHGPSTYVAAIDLAN